MPDVAWVAGSTYVAATSNTTVSATTPAGIGNGDMLIAAVFSRYAVTTPSGWTQLDVTSDFNAGGAVVQRITIFSKNTVTTADSSTAISWVQATSSTNGIGVLYAVARNVSASTITKTSFNNTSTMTIAPPTQTADGLGQLFLMFASTMDISPFETPTAPSGSTLFSGSGGSINAYRLAGSYQARVTGQTNSGNFVFNPSGIPGGANGMGAVTIRLATASPTAIATRISMAGPLSAPALLAEHKQLAYISLPAILGTPRGFLWYDFSAQVEGQTPRYEMTLTTGAGPVVVPISSWQATLQGDASCYVQCVVPACLPYVDTITSATAFTIARVGSVDGAEFSYEMASADLENTQLQQGPLNYSALLTGRSAAFAVDDGLPTSLDRVLVDRRSTAIESNGLRVRCAIDWLLRPGMRAIVDEAPFVVGSISYYVSESDQYMDVKEAQA